MKMEKNNIKISIVTPTYKCSKCLESMYERLVEALQKITDSFEIIFVNDASPDSDWEVITKLAEEDNRVKGVSLSKNFGQHNAITAGLDYATGEWVVVMDCDLQDRPEEIVNLYNKAQEGYDIVYAKRTDRKDRFLKKLSSKLFYKVLSYLTGVEHDETVGNFGIYNKEVVESITNIGENLRYFPVLVRWVGFKSTSIQVEHDPNNERNSAYSYKKLIHLAFNVMLATSNKPLKLVTGLGILISITSFLFAIYLLFRAIMGDYLIAGWPSLIVSIWFLSGIIILTLGVIGLYIGKTFDEVKHKPLYIIKDKLNIEK